MEAVSLGSCMSHTTPNLRVLNSHKLLFLTHFCSPRLAPWQVSSELGFSIPVPYILKKARLGFCTGRWDYSKRTGPSAQGLIKPLRVSHLLMSPQLKQITRLGPALAWNGAMQGVGTGSHDCLAPLS